MNQHPENTKKHNHEIIAWLIEWFPMAFCKNKQQIKPLKLGVFDEIMDFYERLSSPSFSKKALRDALNYYTTSKHYLHCQKANVARIDLFGNEVDTVTIDQANYAKLRYEKRYSSLGSVDN